jgi:hypothetical protein
LLGTAHKHAHSVAEILCIGDELRPQWPQKGAAEVAAFLFNPFAGYFATPTPDILQYPRPIFCNAHARHAELVSAS